MRYTGMRSFDPYAVAGRECGAWVAYYRRRWARFLVDAVGMVRSGFRMPWPRTVRGAWFVLRANQKWAPRDNDPEAARRYMRRFYDLVTATHDEPFDTTEAARREVEWWRVHREAQRDGTSSAALVTALAALYAHVYRVPAETVAVAAAERALAMVVSDKWVADGCDPASPALAEERAALVRSYAALLAAVHRVPGA